MRYSVLSAKKTLHLYNMLLSKLKGGILSQFQSRPGFSIAGVWASTGLRPKLSACTPKFQDVEVTTSKSSCQVIILLCVFVYNKLRIDVRI